MTVFKNEKGKNKKRTTRNSYPRSTHTLGAHQDPNTRQPVDYTSLTAGLAVKGYLADGGTVGKTMRCPTCKRMGVIAKEHRGRQLVVHRGFVDGELLDAIDYCAMDVTR